MREQIARFDGVADIVEDFRLGSVCLGPVGVQSCTEAIPLR